MILSHYKKLFFTLIMPTFYGGGGGAPTQTTSTVTQQSIPDWLRPQTEAMLGEATNQIFNTSLNPSTGKYDISGVKGYTPFSTNPRDYVAGFAVPQQQAYHATRNLQMPGQYTQATDFANAAGQGGLQSAQQALGYGNAGFQSGQLGQQLGVQGGQYYGNMGAQAGQLGQQFGLQSAQNAQNMANMYGAQGAAYGQQAANLAGSAQNYGARGAGYGDLASQLGLQGLQAQQYGMDVGQQARDYAAQAAAAGQNYGNMVTNQGIVNQYMSPYQQAVTDVAKQGALRDFQVGQTYRQSQAAKSGAYGGARQAIENAEAQRNLNTQLQALQTQGSQNAYNQAMANIGQQQQLGLSGLQGAQQGLGTALSGGQLGLSGLAQAISGQNAAMQGQQVGLGGVNAANQAYQTGIQGAQTGLSGVGQYINAGNLGLAGTAQGMQGAQIGLQGVDRQLAGTAQGMRGAGYGLQGVQGAQAGYGLANTAGTNLANIGTAQQAAQLGIINQQANIGAQERQYYQDVINADINNFANAQQYPMQQLGMYNALLRGYATPTSATTAYSPAPSMVSQLGGLGMTGAALYGMTKKEGGKIEEPKKYKSGGLVDLAIANAMGEA